MVICNDDNTFKKMECKIEQFSYYFYNTFPKFIIFLLFLLKVCGETCRTPRQLAGHMRVCHAPDGPEICALCGKSFKNLAFHTYKVYSTIDICECVPVLGLKFAFINNFCFKVHSGKIFTCDHCDFKSTLNCTIKKHIAQVKD